MSVNLVIVADTHLPLRARLPEVARVELAGLRVAVDAEDPSWLT